MQTFLEFICEAKSAKEGEAEARAILRNLSKLSRQTKRALKGEKTDTGETPEQMAKRAENKALAKEYKALSKEHGSGTTRQHKEKGKALKRLALRLLSKAKKKKEAEKAKDMDREGTKEVDQAIIDPNKAEPDQ